MLNMLVGSNKLFPDLRVCLLRGKQYCIETLEHLLLAGMSDRL